jgi:hypothetical protein
MSNAYGAGAPAGGGGAPSWLPSALVPLWNHVYGAGGGPAAQPATREDGIATAQQQMQAGPGNTNAPPFMPWLFGQGANSQGGPILPYLDPKNLRIAQASQLTAPIPPMPAAPFKPPVPPHAGWANSANPGGVYSTIGQGMPTPNQFQPEFANMPSPGMRDPNGVWAPRPNGTPAATPRPAVAAGGGGRGKINPKARAQAPAAAAAPATAPGWDPGFSAPNQDVIGGRGGPLSSRQMGVFDFSKLFNRGS